MQGLTGHNRILLPDFRKVTGQFDRIVSTEMIEAVGQSCRETCFKTLYDRAAYPTYPTCRAWRLIRLPTGCVSGRPVNEWWKQMALSATRVNTAEHDDRMDFIALMARVCEQDRSAFHQVFAHFGPRVKSLMLKSGADPALAEDIVQDVFVAVWRKAGQYAPERGAVGTWIFTIARNIRIDRLRRLSSQPYEDIEAIELVDDQPDAEQEMEAVQRAELVAGALVELPADQREVIELAYLHDLPQSEIASRLALPLGTVKSRMRLAYARLKQKLEEKI